MGRRVFATSVERCERRSAALDESGDIVLIGLRDFQDDKADVIMKYTADEARQLKAYGEIPDNGRLAAVS